MLATLGGILALLAGLAVLLVPLLVPELSRPRDAFWGALVLLLGLVLVTSADRLSGAPMLAVLCGGLLIGRLGSEVSLGRWRQLSDEEQQRFWAPERWSTSLAQLGGSAASLLAGLAAGASWLRHRATPPAKPVTKRWVRSEQPQAAGPPEPPEQPQPAGGAEPVGASAVVEVTSFTDIDALVQEASAAAEIAENAEPGSAPEAESEPGSESSAVAGAEAGSPTSGGGSQEEP